MFSLSASRDSVPNDIHTPDVALYGGGEAADPVPTDPILPEAVHHHRSGEDREIQRSRRGAVQRAARVDEAQAHTGIYIEACCFKARRFILFPRVVVVVVFVHAV